MALCGAYCIWLRRNLLHAYTYTPVICCRQSCINVPLPTDAYLKACGECGETSRDLFHSQFGLVSVCICVQLPGLLRTTA